MQDFVIKIPTAYENVMAAEKSGRERIKTVRRRFEKRRGRVLLTRDGKRLGDENRMGQIKTKMVDQLLIFAQSASD
jgi:hypothetical protein